MNDSIEYSNRRLEGVRSSVQLSIRCKRLCQCEYVVPVPSSYILDVVRNMDATCPYNPTTVLTIAIICPTITQQCSTEQDLMGTTALGITES